ncbi:hypothetical protein [uncultured Fibrobacter sp.]|uniref:hypothetical protein n=1 Tax=uncultured Fibrobacter sp. TaxID=261512 RepID=UPI0025F4081C|nr:hypothetical protein [uncultured Fibrobacter sp.]
MKLKYFIPIFALATATAANALPFKLAPHGEFGWLWANSDGIEFQMGEHGSGFENSDFGIRGELGVIARKTVDADLYVQTGIVAGGSFARYKDKRKGFNHLQITRGHVGIPLAVGYTFINKINIQAGTQLNFEHSDIHYVGDLHKDMYVKFDFTAGASYNITENNELGINVNIRENETALGVSYNYWIF